VSVYKFSVEFRKFTNKPYEAQKMCFDRSELHFANDQFESKHNADNGLYGQPLIRHLTCLTTWEA